MLMNCDVKLKYSLFKITINQPSILLFNIHIQQTLEYLVQLCTP